MVLRLALQSAPHPPVTTIAHGLFFFGYLLE
jgi:hypothetical protein